MLLKTFPFFAMVLIATDVIYEGPFGGPEGDQFVQVYDQGRINHIEWGLIKWRHWSMYGALVITNWESDNQTSHGTSNTKFTNLYYQDHTISCTPFTLRSTDYIIGLTIWYDKEYVYGLQFDTLEQQSYSCYNSTVIIGKNTTTISHSPDTNPNNFYYLTGFNVSYGNNIDAIKFQFTSFSPNSSRSNPSYTPTVNLTMQPSYNPTLAPSVNPTFHPTFGPSLQPTTSNPTPEPTADFTDHPTFNPTTVDSTIPSTQTKAIPSSPCSKCNKYQTTHSKAN